MDHDIKEEVRPLHPEKGLEEDEVPGAADGKKFRQPLHDTKKDGL
jgi:hypothetical protein